MNSVSNTDSMGPVNVLHNGVSNSNQSTCLTIQEVSKDSLSSVRKLPKKRKFDLSELEETPPRTENIVTTTIQNQISSPPPQSTAVDYSCVGSSSTNTNTYNGHANSPVALHQNIYYEPAPKKEHTKPNVNFPIPLISVSNTLPERTEKYTVALHEWVENRVLAKRGQVYVPGIIRRADSSSGCVWVKFDDSLETDLVQFPDVLQAGRYDIISDASPSLNNVTEGTRVCIRTNGSGVDDVSRIFVEGVVSNVLHSPIRFVVRLSDSDDKEYIVKRADIRLLQPPWIDELENEENDLPPPLLPYGNIPTSAVISSNNLSVASSSSYQPSTSTPYCKSAATSPLQVNPAALLPNNVSLPNTSSDEQRRRHNDDPCESDDDLRRENISFPSFDNGRFILWFILYLSSLQILNLFSICFQKWANITFQQPAVKEAAYKVLEVLRVF